MKQRRDLRTSRKTNQGFWHSLWNRFAKKTKKGRATLVEKIRIGSRWFLFLSMLFLVNLYIFYYRPGTSVPSLIQASNDHRQEKALLGYPGMPAWTPKPKVKTESEKFPPLQYFRFREIKLSSKATLDQVLASTHLSKSKRDELLTLLEDQTFQNALDPRSLVLYYDRLNHWIALDYHIDALHAVRIHRNQFDPMASFTVEKMAGALLKKTEAIDLVIAEGATLAESLPEKESKALAQLLIDVFAYERDLQTECHAGDTFKVIVEKVYQGDRFLRYGNMRFARFVSQSPALTLSAAWYTVAPHESGYFTEHGHSVTRSWYRSPVILGSQIPQDWQMKDLQPEWHPQKKRSDSFAVYPAPPRTPVRAILSGTLQVCPKDEGCTLLIAQKDYQVRYLNLTSLASGIHAGETVAAGQLIGYVSAGPVGKKTGVRLSLWNGKRVINPIAGYSPRDSSIPAVSTKKFEEDMQKLFASMAESKSVVAKISSWLSSL